MPEDSDQRMFQKSPPWMSRKHLLIEGVDHGPSCNEICRSVQCHLCGCWKHRIATGGYEEGSYQEYKCPECGFGGSTFNRSGEMRQEVDPSEKLVRVELKLSFEKGGVVLIVKEGADLKFNLNEEKTSHVESTPLETRKKDPQPLVQSSRAGSLDFHLQWSE